MILSFFRLIFWRRKKRKRKKKEKILDINIKNPLNLPFNTAYNTWGTSVSHVSSGSEEIIIKNISFDNKIESIIVQKIDYNNNNVILNYIDGGVKSFIDSKLEYNNILRSLDEKEYFFNAVSSNPFFYLEKIDFNDPMYPSSKNTKNINIGTLDIETYLDTSSTGQKEHKILCICLYNVI